MFQNSKFESDELGNLIQFRDFSKNSASELIASISFGRISILSIDEKKDSYMSSKLFTSSLFRQFWGNILGNNIGFPNLPKLKYASFHNPQN